jgi:hypothetical protein
MAKLLHQIPFWAATSLACLQHNKIVCIEVHMKAFFIGILLLLNLINFSLFNQIIFSRQFVNVLTCNCVNITKYLSRKS